MRMGVREAEGAGAGNGVWGRGGVWKDKCGVYGCV